MRRFEQDLAEYRDERRAFWNANAGRTPGVLGVPYHARLLEVYRSIVPSGSRVIEIGCGRGDLLAALEPSVALGVDFSPDMTAVGSARYPKIEFQTLDMHTADLPDKQWDFIILSDVINDLWDLQSVLENVCRICRPETRIILNFFSHLWQLPLTFARNLGLASPTLRQNWFTVHDLENLLTLTGFESLRVWHEFVIPVKVPGFSALANRVLPKLIPFHWLAMTNFLIAKPLPTRPTQMPVVSVIVAARNEEGHIGELMQRIPEMGAGTEIIFVEGNSSDNTWGAIEREIGNAPHRDCKLLKQRGKGKGDAVRAGFEAARGDILMILDADITVPPEDLPRFYEVLVSGQGEFVNGVRLVYPMEDDAMRLANLVGNKFFSWAFSWLLGQPIRDTLCGTKVLWAKDYRRIAANRRFFGDFDPFGDFDLLFGAAKLNLKIMEVPIRYRARRYGETNIQRWRHGLLLLRMVIFAARRIKFV